jgi:hypothetical protein
MSEKQQADADAHRRRRRRQARQGKFRVPQVPDNEIKLSEKDDRDAAPHGESNEVDPTPFLRAQIEQHDDEQEQAP